MTEEEKNKLDNKLNKLEALKDIIFGEEKREYDDEFAEVQNKISIQGTELEKKINELSLALDGQLKKTQDAFDEKLTQMKEELTTTLNGLNDSKLDKKQFISLFDKVVQNVK
ncbi:MAG: hypothetical protein AB8B61_01310 [Cyclobacteriaceae bacterium]